MPVEHSLVDPLVGFSGRWPTVYHRVREDPGDRAACTNFTQLDFFFRESEMPRVNEEWAMSLTPCVSCQHVWAAKEYPA